MSDALDSAFFKLVTLIGIIIGLIVALVIGLVSWFLWLFCEWIK